MAASASSLKLRKSTTMASFLSASSEDVSILPQVPLAQLMGASVSMTPDSGHKQSRLAAQARSTSPREPTTGGVSPEVRQPPSLKPALLPSLPGGFAPARGSSAGSAAAGAGTGRGPVKIAAPEPSSQLQQELEDLRVRFVAEIEEVRVSPVVARRGTLVFLDDEKVGWVKKYAVVRRPFVFLYYNDSDAVERALLNLSTAKIEYSADRQAMIRVFLNYSTCTLICICSYLRLDMYSRYTLVCYSYLHTLQSNMNSDPTAERVRSFGNH